MAKSPPSASVPPDDSANARAGSLTRLEDAERGFAKARRRRLLLAGGVAILVILGLWSTLRSGDKGNVVYRTEAVTKERLVVTVSATGTLQPTNQVDVGSELSGLLESVSVDFNDHVTKGQVIAKLDTSKLTASALESQAQLEVAEATLAEKKASVVEADAELKRLVAVRKASGGRMPSQADLDTASAALARDHAQVSNAEAQINLARAQVDFDRTNLAKAEIRAPIDGVVLSRDVEPGQAIAASFQTPKLFTLAEDLAQMELQVDVDEADVGQVREGQTASFTVDAYPDRHFPARITQLRFASETVNGVVSYKAVLEVANSDLALRPGMTATADITVATVENALLLPNEALRFVPPREEKDERGLLQKLMPFGRRLGNEEKPAESTDKHRKVYVLKDDKPASVVVSIGLTDGRHTEILDGDVQVGTELVVDAASKGGT